MKVHRITSVLDPLPSSANCIAIDQDRSPSSSSPSNNGHANRSISNSTPVAGMMAVGRENGNIELWQPIRNGTSYWHSATIRASASNNSNNSSPCHSIAWMPKGSDNKMSAWIYSACLDGSIAVYSVDSLRMVGKVECYGGSVWAISTVAVANDAVDESESDGMEYWMAAACEDGSIRLLSLDPLTGIPQYEGLLQQHQPGIPQHQDNSQQEQGMIRRGGRLVSVAWSPNGRMLCAGSSDGCLHVYEHKATVDSGVRQKGQLNAKASSTAVQAQWKLLGSLQVEKPLLNQSQLMDGHGSSSGEEGDEPGQSACILWAVGFVSGGSRHSTSYRSHSAGTLSHSAASNANASRTEPIIVASGDSRGRIVLWDVKTATVIKSVTTHQADILAMAIDSKPTFSAPSNGPSCCIYASGIDSKIVKLEFIGQASTKHSSSSSAAAAQAMLVPSAWKLTWNVRMHSHDVRALALIPQANHRSSSATPVHSSQSLLVSAGLDCKIGIWQTGQLQESHVTVLMPVGRGFAEQTAWTTSSNSDGNTLLAAIDHHDNSVKLWSFECGDDQSGSSSAVCGEQQLSWQQKLFIRLPKMGGDAQQESVGAGMVVVEPEHANWIAVSRGKDTLLYGINWVNQSTAATVATNNSDESVATVENSIDISESGQSIDTSKSGHSIELSQSGQSGQSVQSYQLIWLSILW